MCAYDQPTILTQRIKIKTNFFKGTHIAKIKQTVCGESTEFKTNKRQNGRKLKQLIGYA